MEQNKNSYSHPVVREVIKEIENTLQMDEGLQRNLLVAASQQDEVSRFTAQLALLRQESMTPAQTAQKLQEVQMDKMTVAKAAQEMENENHAAEQKAVAMAEIATATEVPDVAEQAKFNNFAAGKPIDTPVIPDQRTA